MPCLSNREERKCNFRSNCAAALLPAARGSRWHSKSTTAKPEGNCTGGSVSWPRPDQGEGEAGLPRKKHRCGWEAPFATLLATAPRQLRMAGGVDPWV